MLFRSLDPSRFLEGRLPLDAGAAEAAIADRVAGPLGTTVERAAHVIVEVASATMARALRVVTVGRGRDPGVLPLVAFGGAGPLHAVRLAEELGAPRVLIPPLPGFVSALGLLATELRTEVATTVLRSGRRGVSPAGLRRSVSKMARSARARLGPDAEDAAVALALDCRYEGQGYEITVPLSSPTADGVAGARRAFHQLHDARYGHSAPEEPVELVTLRVTAVTPGAGFAPARLQPGAQPTPIDVRKVFSGDAWVDTPTFERSSLPPRWRAPGPLLVLEGESSTWLPTGWSVTVDETGTLEATRATR